MKVYVYRLKHCRVCGKEYQPTNGRQKYCTDCGHAAVNIRHAKWCKTNREKANTRQTKWNKANPEKVKACEAKWQKANSQKNAVYHNKRRALKYANTPISELLTSTEWLASLADAHGHCHYCDKEAKLTLDHVIPLSKGGKHSKDNVVPACQHCNSSKGNKTVEAWNKSTRAQLEAAQ